MYVATYFKHCIKLASWYSSSLTQQANLMVWCLLNLPASQLNAFEALHVHVWVEMLPSCSISLAPSPRARVCWVSMNQSSGLRPPNYGTRRISQRPPRCVQTAIGQIFHLYKARLPCSTTWEIPFRPQALAKTHWSQSRCHQPLYSPLQIESTKLQVTHCHSKSIITYKCTSHNQHMGKSPGANTWPQQYGTQKHWHLKKLNHSFF